MHFEKVLLVTAWLIHASNASGNATIFGNTTTPPRTDICNALTQSNVAIVVVLCVFMMIILVGNALVIGVVCLNDDLRRNTTFILLMSLAVADLLYACIIPVNIQRLLDNRGFCMSETVCWFTIVVERILSVSAMTHLFVIGLERFLSLRFTFRYKEITGTSKFRIGLVVCVWHYAVLWSAVGIPKWSKGMSPSKLGIYYGKGHCKPDNVIYYKTVFATCYYIPIIAMIFTYTYVYHTAMRHIKDIVRNQVDDKATKDLMLKKKQQRTLLSVVLVFLFYIILWVPVSFIAMGFVDARPIPHLVKIILFDLMPPLNSLVNPFIYVISNVQFRHRLSDTFRRNNNSTKEMLNHTNKSYVASPRLSKSYVASPSKFSNQHELKVISNPNT